MTNSCMRRSWAILLALAILLLGLAPASLAKLDNPQDLVPFLKIDLPGWQMKPGFPKLQRLTEGGKSYVEAQAIYTAGQNTLIAVIMKGQTIDEEVAKVRKFPLSDNEKGYCRKINTQAFEGVELYEKESKTAFLFIFVADDCLIPLQAKEVESPKVLRDLVAKINLQKLAALVK